jgi:hypothetical protein
LGPRGEGQAKKAGREGGGTRPAYSSAGESSELISEGGREGYGFISFSLIHNVVYAEIMPYNTKQKFN